MPDTFHRDRGSILLPPKPELTEEGFLRCFMRIAKTGELKYRNADGSERIEVVTPEVLFSKDSIDSFKMKPITLLHPPRRVTPENAMQYQRGMLGHYALVDGDFLGFVGTVTDRTAIDTLLRGDAREASCGYDAPSELRSDGKVYQLKRKGNHTAIVPAGRAGAEVRFNVDAAEDEDCWYQVDALGDLYNADSDTVQEVFRDIAGKQIWDFGKQGNSTPETQADAEDTAVPRQIAFPTGEVFPIADDALADAVLALLADKECGCDEPDDDEPDGDEIVTMELWKTLGYDSADAAVEGLNQKATAFQAKLDAAEGKAAALEPQVAELKTKLDAAESNRMDADAVSTEAANRATTWAVVLPVLRADTADYQPDYKLSVPEIQKLAIAQKLPHLKLDGKSNDYVSAIWETIEPSLKQEDRKDSSTDLLDLLTKTERQDAVPQFQMSAAKQKRADRIAANSKSN